MATEPLAPAVENGRMLPAARILAARCALRLFPMLFPRPSSGENDQSARDRLIVLVRAYELVALGLVPLEPPSDAGRFRAAADLLGGEADHAARCAAAAIRTWSAEDPATHFETMKQHYGAALRQFDAEHPDATSPLLDVGTKAFEAEVQLLRASWESADEDGEDVRSVRARPLWDPAFTLPPQWMTQEEAWRGLLVTAVGLSDVVDRYQTFRSGTATDPGLIQAISAGWNSIAATNATAQSQGNVTPSTAAVQLSGTSPGTTPEPVKRPSLQMLSDAPLTDETRDVLGYGGYADGLAGVIDHPRLDTPFTLAINGPWGSGKTSLANMLERRLREWPPLRGEPSHIICKFNAWLHDDAPKLAAAFAAEVTRVANRHRPIWYRFLRPLPTGLLSAGELRRRRLFLLIVFALVVVGLGWYLSRFWAAEVLGLAKALVEGFGKKAEGAGENVGKGIGVAALVAVIAKAIALLVPAASAVSAFVKSPEDAAARGSLKDVSEQLGKLIGQATRGRRRFVILIDDLERCQPPRAVDVLEVVNLLLGHRGVVTILLADMPAVAACAEIKYNELAQRYAPSDGISPPSSGEAHATQPMGVPAPARRAYGRLYLQKIIQLQFDLPALDRDALKVLVARLSEVEAEQVPEKATRRERLRALATRASDRVVDWLTLWSRAWLTGLGVVLGLVVVALIALPQLGLRTPFNVNLGGVVAIVVIALPLVAQIVNGVQRLAARRRKEKIDREIRLRVRAGSSDISGVEDAVKAVIGVAPAPESGGTKKPTAQEELVRQRAQLFVTDESAVRDEAEEKVMTYLQPLPRYAKRALNRLRMQLGVAYSRGLLKPEVGITAGHLGKWVVLNERWPELAQAFIANPAAAEELEASTLAEFGAKVRHLVPGALEDDVLWTFLRDDPLLGGHLRRLVSHAIEPSAQQVSG